MQTQLPSLGVVIPVKNCRSHLDRHVEGLSTWIDLASEVVVVDSYSEDGSGEFVCRQLDHPNVHLLQHPPGLYASWNRGIQSLSADHGYLATVADRITRDGMQHLRETLLRLDADVLLSKPDFEDEQGQPVEIEWPIDDVIRSLGLSESARLSRAQAATFVLAHAEQAFSGSWASNLFRTSKLKELPFPSDYGYSGDGVWSLQHAAEVFWAVTPRRFTRFRLHVNQPTKTEETSLPSGEVWRQLAKTMISDAEARELLNREQLDGAGIRQLADTKGVFLRWKDEWDRRRRSGLPWILKPSAWCARARRDVALRKVHRLKRDALRLVVSPGC